MELLEIFVKDIPIDQDCSLHAVDGSGFRGVLQQHLMGHAVNNLRILIAEKLAAKFFGRFPHFVLFR